MRLIHTADIHLDTSFAASGMPVACANRRRQGLRDVFHALVERARIWPADALLIAGDLFELDRVSRDTVAFLQREFAYLAPIPVFLAPGNHDPYVPESPYATETWPPNVHIFRTPTWSSVETEDIPLTVHGFAFDGLDISANPFGALRAQQDGRVHIAVAHGSERSHQPPDKQAYAPFHAVEAACPGLTYLALGHFHAATPITGPFTTSMWYSGMPEGRGFNDLGLRHYLEVDISDGIVRVDPMASSRVVYQAHTLSCSAFTTSQQLIEALRALPRNDGRGAMARVTLTGTAAAAWRGSIDAIRDAASSAFEHLDLIDRTEPEEDFVALGRDRTVLGLFAERMNEEIRDTSDPARRAMLLRARELGVAAYRGRNLFLADAPENAP